MIHKMILSPTIDSHLTTIVQLQMDLLYCAATKGMMSKNICADYLDNEPLDACFKGHGKAIAGWLWAQGTSTRHAHLEKFATTYTSTYLEEQQEEQQQKKEWCQRLAKEVALLSDVKLPYIEIANFFGDAPLPNCKKRLTYTWKGEAHCFLLYFYENFLGGDDIFPQELFSGAAPFGRQAFLDAFLAANTSLETCAICDESRYFTQGKNRHIYASIDHFFPKSRYPHFACHPYNLLPTCHACNSSLKEQKDPLDNNNGSRQLSRYSLPYRDINWGVDAYLEVMLGKMIEFKALISRKDANGQRNPQKQEALELLSYLYDIPGRWPADKISETLFRRMRQFLGNGKGGPQSFNMPSEIHNTLEQLLYYLDQEDRQKDPFAFAMTWILVAILEEQIQPLIDGKKGFCSSLLTEIMSWFGQDAEKNRSRAAIAQSLRAVSKQ